MILIFWLIILLTKLFIELVSRCIESILPHAVLGGHSLLHEEIELKPRLEIF